jgi:hypothetical protein
VRNAGIECDKQRRQGCGMTKSKATSFIRNDAPIAVRAFPIDAQKTKQWRSPVAQAEKNFS